MTTYTAIILGQIDQDSPVTQPLVTALRDNPIAIAEGASGAPRIEDAALDATATTPGAVWVTNRIALVGNGGLGTYAYLKPTGTSTITPGSNVAGSGLEYTDGSNTVASPSLSGTWKCMGYSVGGTGTVFLRVV